MSDDDDLGWAGASTKVTGATGVADVFDSLVNSKGKTTFFGIGPKRLRKAAKAILEKNNMKLLNNTNEVKKILGSVFDNSETKVEASCYLLNRALITDVLVEPKFLNKVCARIADRIKDDKKGKGIGPTYTDKVSRTGLRVGDILDNFEEKYAAAAAHSVFSAWCVTESTRDGMRERTSRWSLRSWSWQTPRTG